MIAQRSRARSAEPKPGGPPLLRACRGRLRVRLGGCSDQHDDPPQRTNGAQNPRVGKGGRPVALGLGRVDAAQRVASGRDPPTLHVPHAAPPRSSCGGLGHCPWGVFLLTLGATRPRLLRMNLHQPSNDTFLFATNDLLKRTRAGDREAIEILFRRYRQVLQDFLHKRLPPASRSLLETEDLVQEVLTRAITALPSFEYRGIGSFWAYLRQIGLNHLSEMARKSQRADQRAVSLHESSVIERGSRSLISIVSS